MNSCWRKGGKSPSMDPLHFCIAVAPLAVYLLLLGILNLLSRPFVTTGARDTAALGIGISGLIIAGPMELFFPEAAASQFGVYVWLMLIAFYGLCVSLVVLLMKPRIVVYNVSRDQLMPILKSTVHKMDGQVKWANESAHLPTAQVHFYVESNDALRNIQLVAGGNRQNFEQWRELEKALKSGLESLKVRPNLIGIVFLLISGIVSAFTAIWMVNETETVAKALEEMLRR